MSVIRNGSRHRPAAPTVSINLGVAVSHLRVLAARPLSSSAGWILLLGRCLARDLVQDLRHSRMSDVIQNYDDASSLMTSLVAGTSMPTFSTERDSLSISLSLKDTKL